ncbi:homoserine dehydrogenase [Sporosarcina highlanderae]|uniref:Homoserine dehydrogenase n=1 Tax=Sporosarcina highlanderae TaxID=3035916 RepID=A0ABT8JMG8_9BACL|nr:homoserine dehydrogenase [Sporosarcina highlanderae]MDN4606237.1 homoserine dehydrogenase [Sporosarcina highlanderae]
MPSIKVAILGFGTVGEGVYRILQEKRDEIKKSTGFTVEVEIILVKDKNKKRMPIKGIQITDNFQDILNNPEIDIVFEAIVGEEPAYTYLSDTIEKGCHIITANKKMFAEHGPALMKHAEFRNVQIGYEATVAGGVPIIRTVTNLLSGDQVKRIQGILNGTSNFILTKMRKEGSSFKEALFEAQRKGFAEADPSDDVSGMDAFRKLMILSSLAFGEQPDWDEVPVVGIDHLPSNEITDAAKEDYRYRHVADIWLDEKGEPQGTVGPALIGANHPFFNIDGVDNAVIVETEYLGSLTVVGPGAGMYPTGSAMIADLIHIIRQQEAVLIPN